jgi:hypothetical protein
MPSLSAPTPECELRNFHTSLKRFQTVGFHERVAEQILDYPTSLDNMLGRSLRQCEYFETSDAFHDPRKGADGITEAMSTNGGWANSLVVSIARRKATWPGEGLSFKYVDYEIAPFRESGEVGRLRHQLPEAMTGRFDLLLSDAADRTPVIVEVKAAGDPATLPITVIQLLTYAVEMGTLHQRRRLTSIYGDAFASPSEQPRLDLCVMKEIPGALSTQSGENSEERHAQVQQLCEKLLTLPHARKLIRRIVWLHPEMTSSGETSFATRFVCGDV